MERFLWGSVAGYVVPTRLFGMRRNVSRQNCGEVMLTTTVRGFPYA